MHLLAVVRQGFPGTRPHLGPRGTRDSVFYRGTGCTSVPGFTAGSIPGTRLAYRTNSRGRSVLILGGLPHARPGVSCPPGPSNTPACAEVGPAGGLGGGTPQEGDEDLGGGSSLANRYWFRFLGLSVLLLTVARQGSSLSLSLELACEFRSPLLATGKQTRAVQDQSIFVCSWCSSLPGRIGGTGQRATGQAFPRQEAQQSDCRTFSFRIDSQGGPSQSPNTRTGAVVPNLVQ